MSQLSQGLRFDLPDTLAGDCEVLADLFERMLRSGIAQAETHLDHFLFTRRERRKDLVSNFTKVRESYRFRRIQYRFVFDKVPEMRIFLFTDRRLERDGFLRDLQNLSHFRNRNVHPLRDLFRRRLTAKLLHQQTRSADELVDRLDHVNRDTDRACLVGDRTGDRLPDPPRRVCRELITATPFELVDGL